MSGEMSGLTHEAILDASPIPTTVVDRGGTIVYVNDAFLSQASEVREVEIQREDRLGRPVLDFVGSGSEYSRQEWMEMYDRVLREGETVRLQAYRGYPSPDREMYTDVWMNPVRGEDGEVVAAVVTWQDVTDRVKRGKEARRGAAVDRVRAEVYGMKRLEDVDRMLTTMYHELREIGVTFSTCGINVSMEGTEPAAFASYSVSSDKVWEMASSAEAGRRLETMWRKGEPTYRRDLASEDVYGEKEYIGEIWGKPIRSVLDVPFLGGTLAINSVEPDAFSAEDIELMQRFADVVSAGYTRFKDISSREESEKRLRTEQDFRSRLIDISPAFFVVLDAEWKTVLMNRSMLEALGYSEDEIQGTDYLSTFIPERDHERVSLVFERFFRTGEASISENHVLAKDGEELLVEWHGCPILNAEGAVESFFGVGADITERNRMQEALRDSEKNLRAILDASPIPTTVVDREGTVVYVNNMLLDHASMMRGTEVRREDRVEGNVLDFIPEQSVHSRQTWWEIYSRVLEGGESVFLEELDEPSLKPELYMDIRMNPVKGEDGQVLAAVVTTQDVTDRVKARRERARRAALDRVRVAVYEMRGVTDIEGVLVSIRESLEEVGLKFEDCTVQFVDDEADTFKIYRIGADGVKGRTSGSRLRESPVYEVWRDQRVLYRRDLDADEVSDERMRLRAFSGKPIRSVVDVPFSHGTVAINSLQLEAFSEEDIETLEQLASVLSDAYTRFEDIRRLKESEERYRTLVENVNIGIYRNTGGPEGRFLQVNPAMAMMFGYDSVEECMEISVSDLYQYAEDRQLFVDEVVREGAVRNRELRLRKRDGTPIWASCTATAHFGASREIEWVDGVIEDITERKRSEDALRAMSVELSRVEEEERRRLARELHDRVGQNLTALSLNLNLVQGLLPEAVAEIVSGRLEDSLGLVGETVERVRDVMADLRPSVLDDYGLLAALRWYGERFSRRAGVEVEVVGEEMDSRLASEVETELFRICQEALTNVGKHAQASKAVVTLDVGEDGIRMRIADDGVGFDVEERQTSDGVSGWGLLNMRERALVVEGVLRVVSAPGEGTEVVVEIGMR